LQEERGIDEGFVVQPQGVLDLCLGGAHILFGQGLPFARFTLMGVKNHELELAAFAAGDAAHNPVDL